MTGETSTKFSAKDGLAPCGCELLAKPLTVPKRTITFWKKYPIVVSALVYCPTHGWVNASDTYMKQLGAVQ